jgi:hypothetical protein
MPLLAELIDLLIPVLASCRPNGAKENTFATRGRSYGRVLRYSSI